MHDSQLINTASVPNRSEESIFFSESDASALVKETPGEEAYVYITLGGTGVCSRINVSPVISDRMTFEWIEETGTSTVRALNFEIRQLEMIYEFRNSLEIVDYLKTYPFLIELLVEAFPEIERFFGRNPRVVLKLVKDPDIEGEEQLFAYIHTTLSAEEALNRMNRLDEEWFLTQIHRTEEKFNLNIEFV